MTDILLSISWGLSLVLFFFLGGAVGASWQMKMQARTIETIGRQFRIGLMQLFAGRGNAE